MKTDGDGRPTGERGKISAAKIAAALGLGGPESLKKPEGGTGRPLRSPAQIRAEQEGREPPPDPEGFKRTVVSVGRDVWEFLGRPTTTPLGEGEEGKPLPPEPSSPEEEAKRDREAVLAAYRNRGALGNKPQRADWEKIDEQRKARDLGRQIDKAVADAKKLLRKEAEIEVRRRKRRRSS
jgi:hypothetical protein